MAPVLSDGLLCSGSSSNGSGSGSGVGAGSSNSDSGSDDSSSKSSTTVAPVSCTHEELSAIYSLQRFAEVWIAIMRALRHVARGEELTFSYSSKLWCSAAMTCSRCMASRIRVSHRAARGPADISTRCPLNALCDGAWAAAVQYTRVEIFFACSEEHPWSAPKSPPLPHTAPCTTHLAKRGSYHQTRRARFLRRTRA
eukprot:4498195-Prymnesium_polylepis.2